MSDQTTLYDFAVELLDACADALGTTAAGAPDRRFVSPGLPVIDCCPLLAVHVGSILEGQTAPSSPPMVTGHRPSFMRQPLVQMVITIVRCVPVGSGDNANSYSPPSVAQLDAAAEVLAIDAWVIVNYLNWRQRAGDLFLGGCQAVFIDPAVSLDPQGGCGGWQIPVRAAIDGYDAYGSP